MILEKKGVGKIIICFMIYRCACKTASGKSGTVALLSGQTLSVPIYGRTFFFGHGQKYDLFDIGFKSY